MTLGGAYDETLEAWAARGGRSLSTYFNWDEVERLSVAADRYNLRIEARGARYDYDTDGLGDALRALPERIDSL